MSGKIRRPPLDLIQDMRFQRREWLIQRLGWFIGLLVLIAALAGLFGYGPASRSTASDPSRQLRIEYERFGRLDAAHEVSVWVEPPLFSGDQVEVWIDRGYIDAQQIDSITPPPSSVEPGQERCTFIFPAPRGGDAAYIVFRMAPQKPGRYTGRVGAAGGPDLPLKTLIYP